MIAFTRIVRLLPMAVALGGALAGCATNDEPSVKFVDGFNPPPAPAGYTRFVTPPIPGIAPGANVEMCSWVGAASTEDRDVLAMDGFQSKTGHHAVVYATT